MSDTYRDKNTAKAKKFFEQHENYRNTAVEGIKHWNQIEKEAAIEKIDLRSGAYKNTWMRRFNWKRVRQHIRQVLHSRQFNRLYDKDAHLKEWLD